MERISKAEIVKAALAIMALLLFFCACSKPKTNPQSSIPEATVIKIETKDAPVVFDYIGQTQSSHLVEIRARVDGYLENIAYEEGSIVKKGQLLFQIDPKPFKTDLEQKKAILAQATAAWENAKETLARVKPLAEKNAVSKMDLDNAVANERTSHAQVLSANAQVQTSELNLSYTTITSPLLGASSKAYKQEGAYISPAGGDNLLTTVALLDPIWVNFSISENEYLKMLEAVKNGSLIVPKNSNFTVKIKLSDNTSFPETGYLSFAEPSFSQETGTFLVRSVFKNPKYILRPGQFVKVELHGAIRPNAIIAPRRSVNQGAKGYYVWTISSDNKAELRNVEIGEWYGNHVFITNGLKSGDCLVVDGLLKMVAGAPVKVSEVKISDSGSIRVKRDVGTKGAK